MVPKAQSLRFGHHALAVLGAAMLGSTVFSLIWSAALVIAAHNRLPGMTWLAMFTLLCWFGVFVIALPGAGLTLSLLWPITRRGTAAARWLCIIAGATMGVVLAPLASPKLHGATVIQLCIFALTGAGVAAIYLAITNRLGRTLYQAP